MASLGLLRTWAAVLSLVRGSCGLATTPQYDIEVGTRVDGTNLPGSPLHVPANDTAACHLACEHNPDCIGWVLDTPNYHCQKPAEPPGKSDCWLQGTWGIQWGDPCRISGLVRAPPALAIAATINLTNLTHRLRPLDMGCHSDTGYSHQPRNLYAQKIYGSSFEFASNRPDGTGWVDASVGTGNTATHNTGTAKHGEASELLTFNASAASGGRAAVANRGLGNEGLFLQPDKPYQGYFFAKSSTPTKIKVSLETWGVDSSPPKVLASNILSFAGGNWSRLNFSLTPNSAAECIGLVPNSSAARAANITCPVNGTYNPTGPVSDRTAHICVQCAGQFVLALEEPGSVAIDFVYLSPGGWGLFKDLPVLAEGVKWLQNMGTTLFRAGGSFACSSDMFWKQWRGKPWTRPSRTVTWGHDLEAGWGPFDVIDMCNAMEIEPVVTTFAVGVTPEDMADLVEYSFGNASTQWGKLRIEEDDHPAPYNWSFIELGNEQANPQFAEQVAAMEARAKLIGLPPKKFKYLYPTAKIDAKVSAATAKLGLEDQLIYDEHTSWGGGVNGFHAILASPLTGPSGWGGINLETNCGDHTHKRALEEAFDLNTFALEGNPRLFGRAASFCMERSGYQEAGLNDQGMIFFLPNMTWGQPPFYSHQMIHQSWQPNVVAVTTNATTTGTSFVCPETLRDQQNGWWHESDVQSADGGSDGSCPGALTAQVSDDGKTLVVRFVNMGVGPVILDLQIAPRTASAAELQVLHSDKLTAVNTPARPLAVVPTTVKMSTGTNFSTLSAVPVPPQAFAVVQVALV